MYIQHISSHFTYITLHLSNYIIISYYYTFHNSIILQTSIDIIINTNPQQQMLIIDINLYREGVADQIIYDIIVKMRAINRIAVFVFFCVLSEEINKECSSDSTCPTNAQCSDSYCQCQTPYILDCQTPSFSLTSTPTSYILSDNPIYFNVYPRKIDTIYVFTYYVCSEQYISLKNYQLTFDVYVDTGSDQLNSNNYVGSKNVELSYINALNGKCQGFAQTQLSLGSQPNGEPETLVAIAAIEPLSASAEVDDPFVTLEFYIEANEIIQNNTFINVSIGIICVTAFGALCAVIFCCYYKWKVRQEQNRAVQQKQHEIEYLKKLIPQIQAGTLNLPLLTSCSICLSEFQQSDKVRKLVCSHIFHTACIDSWCLKNLNCPVCRFQLNEESIKLRKRQLDENSHFKWEENQLSNREVMMRDNDEIYSAPDVPQVPQIRELPRHNMREEAL